MRMNEDGEKQAQKPPPKKKSKLKIFLVVFLAVVLAGAAYAVWTHLQDDGEEDTEASHVPEFTFPPLDFTVNLADTEQRRFLKATVQLGYNDKNLRGEMESRVPEIRDLIIEVFRSKTVSEINTPQGTGELRTQLREELNRRFQGGEIMEIYFTEFIIQ